MGHEENIILITARFVTVAESAGVQLVALCMRGNEFHDDVAGRNCGSGLEDSTASAAPIGISEP